MIKAGVLALWNFAPITLQVPDNVIVRNESLAAGYALLSYELEQNLYWRSEVYEKHVDEQTDGSPALSESK